MNSQSSEHGDRYEGSEEQFLIPKRANLAFTKIKSGIPLFTQAMAVLNVVMAILQATSLGILHGLMPSMPSIPSLPGGCNCPDVPAVPVLEPWSPALEVVIPVIKRFKPEMLYQSETSDLVEEAWERLQGPNHGTVALEKHDWERLEDDRHQSVASDFEPDKRIHGTSMHHQLHCLNVIRKSFYRSKFYPNLSDSQFNFRKNNCFDFLRQAIQCHGDVAMTYWWNENYTKIMPDRTLGYSDLYLNANATERIKGASIHWNIEHSCRMIEPIEKWVAERPSHLNLAENLDIF